MKFTELKNELLRRKRRGIKPKLRDKNISFTPFIDNLKETLAIVDNEMENSLKELDLINNYIENKYLYLKRGILQ